MNDGGPAFPVAADFGPDDRQMNEGMSLRDWFAGQALAGMDITKYAATHTASVIADAMAHDAYEIADAMLEERSKQKKA